MAAPVRVFVAGAWGSVISEAVILSTFEHPAATLVGTTFDPVNPEALAEANPDLLVSAAHRWLLSPAVLALPRLGAVGFHPSLLPRYRGSWPLWWALRNDEREVGLTLFRLSEVVDAGPILDQRRLAVISGEGFTALYERVARLVEPMFNDLIEQIAASGALAEGRPQDSALATQCLPPTTLQRVLGDSRRVIRRQRRKWLPPRLPHGRP